MSDRIPICPKCKAILNFAGTMIASKPLGGFTEARTIYSCRTCKKEYLEDEIKYKSSLASSVSLRSFERPIS